jgi:hypothetical protein
MARPVKVTTASVEVRAELRRRAKAPTSAHRDRFRANIILLRWPVVCESPNPIRMALII